MNNKIFSFLFASLLWLSAGSAGIFAETLLVFTVNSVDMNADEPDVRVVGLQSAVEEGIMSVLFNDGHIVFNAGVVSSNEKLDIASDRLSVRLAKNGGASWLLEVDLGYVSKGPEISLANAEYRLYHLNTDKEIISGEVSPAEVKSRPDQDDEELGEAMGEGIGYNVIRWLSDGSLAKFP